MTIIQSNICFVELADFYGQGVELGEPSATGDDDQGFNLLNIYPGFDLVNRLATHYPGAGSFRL